jgi:hypothetical protein
MGVKNCSIIPSGPGLTRRRCVKPLLGKRKLRAAEYVAMAVDGA